MQITIGSGKTRKTSMIPSLAGARINKDTRVVREQAIEALKNFLFRPAVLLAGKK